MRVNGDLNLMGNFLLNFALEQINKWPKEPRVGTFIFKDQRIYLCINIDTDVPVWLPVSTELHTHVHEQMNSDVEWEIEHNLACTTCLVQISDGAGFAVEPDEIEFNYNRVTVRFAEPMAGRAVLVHGATEGIPRMPVAWQQAFSEASAIWVVTHGLGYAPIVRAFSGQMEVQPISVVHSEDLRSTVLTFASPISGRVRCI